MKYSLNLIPLLTSNTSSGTASASSQFSTPTYSAYKAMDKNGNEYWATTIAGVTPSWISYEFSANSYTVDRYTITSRADFYNGSPRDFLFQGSHDGSSWTTLDTQSDIEFTYHEEKEFDISNTTKYEFYRLYISQNNGRSTTNIAGLGLFKYAEDGSNISDVSLQAELEATKLKVSDISLQTEFTFNHVEICDLGLQVEILEPNPTIYTTFPGMYIKAYLNDDLRFTGIVNDTSLKKDNTTYFQEVRCVSLNNIPTRRNIKVEYSEDTTASTIVNDMIDDYLVLEGIEAGEIHDGANLIEEWKNELINISDVLDEIASKSGYVWFIDKDMKLNFYQDPTTVSGCTYSMNESITSFNDYRDFVIDESIENYVNKVFAVGGNDFHNDLIYTVNGDLTKQNEMQYICGGTGVYGLVHRNNSLLEHDYYICEASTDTDTIYYTNHNMEIGDFFWNVTRDAYSYVTLVIDANSLQCEEIAGQTAGDTLEVYREVNDVGKNILSRQYTLPQKVSFMSYATEFNPSELLTVSVSDMSLSAIYNIDEVSISEKQSGYFETIVKAVRRTEDNFSTQKEPTYVDYFRGF